MPSKPDRLEALEQAVRASYLGEPGAELEAVHLATMARAISQADEAAVAAPRLRRPLWRRARAGLAAGAALIAIPLSLAALAVAGVNLPDPAASVFSAIGIELPNQSSIGDGRGDERSGREGGSAGDEGGRHARPGLERGDERAGAGDDRGSGAARSRSDSSGGRSQSTPSTPPEGTPSAPPEGAPGTQPGGTPSGPPEGTPQSAPDASGSAPGGPSGDPHAIAPMPPAELLDRSAGPRGPGR